MALTRKKGGKDVEDSELEATDASVTPVYGEESTELEDFLDGLGTNDQISVERKSPLDMQGYVGTFPWDPGLDIHEELRRAYGGGHYLIRVKRQAKGGRIMFGKGSRLVKISGDPKVATSSSLVPVVQQNQFGSIDLQEKILEAIAKAGAGQKDSAQTVELVRSIMQIAAPQRGGGETNALSQLLAAAEAGKKLAGMFGGTASPARSRDDDDDDDDDDDGGDPTDRMMNKAFQLMMMKMMQGNAAPAAAPSQALGAAEALRNAPGPQILRGAHDSRPRTPPPQMPPPPGTTWVYHHAVGWFLSYAQKANQNEKASDGISSSARTGNFRGSVPGAQVSAVDHQHNAAHGRSATDARDGARRVTTLPNPHQSGGVVGDGDHHEKKKRSIEPWPTREQWDRVRGEESKKAGYDMIVTQEDMERIKMNTKPTNEEWASVGVTASLNPVCKQCGSLNLTYATDGGETMRCEDCRHEQAAVIEKADLQPFGTVLVPVPDSEEDEVSGDDILRACLACSGDGKKRSSETDEPDGPCPVCNGHGVVRIVNPRPSAAALEETDSATGQQRPVYEGFQGEPRPDDILSVCLACNGDGYERSSETDEQIGTCPKCEGQGIVLNLAPRLSAAALEETDSATGQQRHVYEGFQGEPFAERYHRESPVAADELIGDNHELYTNDDGEPVQCNDADCEGWLFAIHGGDTFQCATCGALHDLNFEIIEDDSDDDESEPPTPDEWAQDFAEMPHDEKEEALRVLAKKLGVAEEIAEMLIANMPSVKGGEDA